MWVQPWGFDIHQVNLHSLSNIERSPVLEINGVFLFCSTPKLKRLKQGEADSPGTPSLAAAGIARCTHMSPSVLQHSSVRLEGSQDIFHILLQAVML